LGFAFIGPRESGIVQPHVPDTPTWIALGALACGGVSFFFSLSETALFTLSPWQVRQLAEKEPRRGAVLAELLAHPQDVLAAIVLGNVFASAGVVAGALWLVVNAGWPGWLVVPAALLFLLGFAEVLPKTLAARVPEVWALRVARPLRWFRRVSKPVRWIGQQTSEFLAARLLPKSLKPVTGAADEDYAELVELACKQGALGRGQKDMILQILALDRRTAKDVMRPRAQMDALPDDLPVEEMIAAARRLKHRRLPLYDGSLDSIAAILNAQKLLLDPNADFSEVVESPSFVPESINLLQLFKRLQRSRRGVAIVVDEYGSTAGIVTIEDILGSMVGHIRGEGEPEGFILEKAGEGRWRVTGTMRLEDFRREFPDVPELPDVDTVGGLVVAVAECVPAPGQSVVYGGLRWTAAVADERRVREVLVERLGKGGGAR
jgi:CBS domain containing-hemolysin-like protein